MPVWLNSGQFAFQVQCIASPEGSQIEPDLGDSVSPERQKPETLV